MMPCVADPERWATATKPDPGAQALCRTACPIRKSCLRTALNGARAEGIWGGVFLPDDSASGRQRQHALNHARHTLAVIDIEVA
jgi:hypothetical protein